MHSKIVSYYSRFNWVVERLTRRLGVLIGSTILYVRVLNVFWAEVSRAAVEVRNPVTKSGRSSSGFQCKLVSWPKSSLSDLSVLRCQRWFLNHPKIKSNRDQMANETIPNRYAIGSRTTICRPKLSKAWCLQRKLILTWTALMVFLARSSKVASVQII